jgi:hypothetical protein
VAKISPVGGVDISKATSGVFVAIEGYEAFIDMLFVSQEGIIKATKKAISGVTEDYYNTVYEKVSLDDHTIKELAALGHPYKKGTGMSPIGVFKDRTGYGGTGPLGHSLAFVHTHTDKMRSSLEYKVKSRLNEVFGIVGWEEANSPEYVPHVLFGTNKMISRNVLLMSKKEKAEMVNMIRILLIEFTRPVLTRAQKEQRHKQLQGASKAKGWRARQSSLMGRIAKSSLRF